MFTSRELAECASKELHRRKDVAPRAVRERKEKMSEAFAQADDNLVKTFQFLKKRNDEVFYVQSHNLQKMFIECQKRLKEIEKDWFSAHDKPDNH